MAEDAFSIMPQLFSSIHNFAIRWDRNSCLICEGGGGVELHNIYYPKQGKKIVSPSSIL